MKKKLCLPAAIGFVLITTLFAHNSQAACEITKEPFGTVNGNQIHIYTLTNNNGIIAKIINYGAILYSLEVPDRDGKVEDITLGYSTLQEYATTRKYFGATIGRYGNRIANGEFELDGQSYNLTRNNNGNHLHGGEKGFNEVIWEAEKVEDSEKVGVRLTYLSEDGEEGYPGNLEVTVTYTLTNDDELKIDYEAETDKATPVNLTHHSFWNLSGNVKDNILDHKLMLNANYYLPVDTGLIPTGEILKVEGTPMNFTQPTTIGCRIWQVTGGYDHCYVLNRSNDEDKLALAARVYEPESGRVMEIHTTEPGIQFYSGNFFDGSIKGKKGKVYNKHDAFCLETQHFPDSPNRHYFPSTILRPGEIYKHICVHKFYTK